MIDKVTITRDDVIYDLTYLRDKFLDWAVKSGKKNDKEGLKIYHRLTASLEFALMELIEDETSGSK